MPRRLLLKKVFSISLVLGIFFSLTSCLLAEIKLEGKTEIDRDTQWDLKLTGLPDKCIVFWNFLNNAQDITKSNLPKSLRGRFIGNGPPNKYRLQIQIITFDKDLNPENEEITVDLIVKGKADPPKPIDPPNPPDPPKPPDPPTPNPSPIPLPGFRVLILYDALAKTKMPKEQQSILTSKSVRDYLKTHCTTDRFAEQDSKAYRIWPSDTVADAPGLESWRDAMKRPRTGLPWILISNHPKGGYEGLLPENSEKTLELLKKYAEPMTSLKLDGTLNTNLNLREFDLPYKHLKINSKGGK